MLRIFFIGIALLTTTAALCQNKKEMDEPVHHFCVNINAGLGANYNTWFLEVQGEYNPISFLGINVGMKFLNPCKQDESLHIVCPEGKYELDEYSTFMYHFILHPSIHLCAPSIKLDNVGDKLVFRMEYGILLPLNHFTKGHAYPQPDNGQLPDSYSPIDIKNIKSGTPFYHETSVSANLVSDRWKFTLGYAFSNLDIYGSARNAYLGNTHIEFEKKKRGDEVFIGIGYYL